MEELLKELEESAQDLIANGDTFDEFEGKGKLKIIEQIKLFISKNKTERILITVEGGLVQGVNTNFDCDVYVLDFDNEGWNVREEQKLTDPEGNRIEAYLYDAPCEVDPEIVSHYVKQI